MSFDLIGIMNAAKEAGIDPNNIQSLIANEEERYRKECERR